MADEYYERYKHLSHQELYRMLQAGSSNQVDTVADNWASVGDTVSAISAALQHDLKRLLPDWTSQGSREFHYRLDVIARYAQTLADAANAMRTGLTVMASSLRETQRRAESPAAAPHSMFGAGDVVDGVVGTNLGRVPPVAEQTQAHERMVRLVARLAAEYGVADHGNWPLMVPEAPIDLPASGVGTGLAGGVGLVAPKPRRHDHGRGHDRDRDRDRDRDHRHGHGERSGSSVHTHVGSLGAAVIGGASGWSQYGRPAHLASHAIGVELSAGGHSPVSGVSGGSGGSGSSGGGSGGSGSGSGGSGSGGSGGPGGSGGGSGGSGATGAGTSSGAMGAGGAGTAMPMAPMGGVAPAGGVTGGGAPAPAMGGGAVSSAERAWHTPDSVDWADPDDDAAPSVLSD